MVERVCKTCGHNTFVGNQMVREEAVFYGDGSFIEVIEQYDFSPPAGPFRCRGCGATAESLGQLTVVRGD